MCFGGFNRPLLAVDIMSCQMEGILLWVISSVSTLKSISSENSQESVSIQASILYARFGIFMLDSLKHSGAGGHEKSCFASLIIDKTAFETWKIVEDSVVLTSLTQFWSREVFSGCNSFKFCSTTMPFGIASEKIISDSAR